MLREPTANALRERVELCYNTILILRRELGYPLRRCFDLLPSALHRALSEGRRTEDVIESTNSGMAWAKDPDDPGRQVEATEERPLNTPDELAELAAEGLPDGQ